MTLVFQQVQIKRGWLHLLNIRPSSFSRKWSLINTSLEPTRNFSVEIPPTTYIGRLIRDEPPKVFEYPDWNSLSRKEFWKQHELWRQHRHFSKRQHFLDYRHEQLLIYFSLFAAAGVACYLFFGTYSMQDNSARIFKAATQIVQQSPIVKDLIGPPLFCFGTCGARKKYPYYRVYPVDDLGLITVMYMRFNVSGSNGRGHVELQAKMEDGGGTVTVEFFRFSPHQGDTWELRRAGSKLQATGLL